MIGIVLLIFLVVGSVYFGQHTIKTIRTLQLACHNAFLMIDTCFSRREDSLQLLITIAKEEQQGYEILLNNINLAQQELTLAKTIDVRIAKDEALRRAISRFLSETKYEKESKHLVDVKEELLFIESQVKYNRFEYNQRVIRYNQYIETFPQRIVALIMKAKPYKKFTEDDKGV